MLAVAKLKNQEAVLQWQKCYHFSLQYLLIVVVTVVESQVSGHVSSVVWSNMFLLSLLFVLVINRVIQIYDIFHLTV